MLTIVSSVMNGFSRDLRKAIREMQSDLIIKGDELWIVDYDRAIKALKEDPLVLGASPRIEYPVALKTVSSKQDMLLVAIDPQLEKNTSDISDYFKRGGKKKFNFDYDSGIKPVYSGLVRGTEENQPFLYVIPGQRVELVTIRDNSTVGTVVDGRFEVVGLFNSGMYEYDYRTVFTSIEAAQDIFKISKKNFANKIAIKIRDYDKNKTEAVQRITSIWHSIKKCSNPDNHKYGKCGGYEIKTWEKEKESFLKAVDLEKNLQVIILFFIIIVAIFNMSAIYTLIVRAKTRDIGILKALGATDNGIASIFLLCGIFCFVIGALFGVACGILVADNLHSIVEFVESTSVQINHLKNFQSEHWFIQGFYPIAIGGLVILMASVILSVILKKTWFVILSATATFFYVLIAFMILGILADPSKGPGWQGYNIFPKNIYYIQRIPSDVHYPTLAFFVISSFVVCLLFSIFPARAASKLDPVEAIRRE